MAYLIPHSAARYPRPVADSLDAPIGPPPAPWRPSPAAKALLESGCGIVDRSHRGRLTLAGPDAAALLQGQLSNDVEALSPGQGLEAGLLTPKGKLLGIVRVLATGEDTFHLDTDRVSLQSLFDAIRRAGVGHDAELGKATVETAQVSLIGPRSDAVVGGSDIPSLHDSRSALLGGARVRVVRTVEGFDVLAPEGAREGVLTALIAAGAEEGDEAAAECLRVEAGIPRFGIDLDDSVIPQEADLNQRLVSFTKGCYVGQETVARLFYRGSPNRVLRGLLLDAEVPPGTPLLEGNREVGRVGSVAAPPGDAVLGLALVRIDSAPGTILDAGGVEADVVELPFTLPDSPGGAA